MKKFIFTVTALLFINHISFTQIKETIHIWNDKVPGEINEKKTATSSTNKDGSTTKLTDITDPILEVFMPDRDNSNGQAIVVCPGGAYKILAIDKEGYEIAEWLTTLGYTAYVLQYRVPNKEVGALQDAQRAIRIVKSKGFNKVGIMGFSAGGSLSTRASTRFNELTYPKQDERDTLSCRPDFTILIYPAYLDKGENRSLTPELTMSSEVPPFFIFATADDKYSNSALVMTTALRDNKTPVELHMLPFGGHGYGLRKGTAAKTWPALLEKWLKNK